ncbi:GAF domain-containing protein [Sphingomonas sp. OV641]|nr:GAF domain-containing protein [Sphingomonas sp. OV641]
MEEKLTGPLLANSGPDAKQEIIRQAAVYASGVLSMAGDPALQQLVEQAAREFQVPIAALSIVDRDRQWFPACVGLDMEQTSREISFCAHAVIHPDQIMIVLDATLDPRFSANPFVTGPTNIRFYLGCPIRDRDGRALGTLCVIDVTSRARVTEADLDRLRDLARHAGDIILQPEVSARDRRQALDGISGQIEVLIRDGEEDGVDELDAMLRRLERQEERDRQRKS